MIDIQQVETINNIPDTILILISFSPITIIINNFQDAELKMAKENVEKICTVSPRTE